MTKLHSCYLASPINPNGISSKFFHFNHMQLIPLMSSIQEDVEEEPVTFFEPSSPYYLATMYATVAGLTVFLCCGILYQVLCYKNISGTNSKLRRLRTTKVGKLLWVSIFLRGLFTAEASAKEGGRCPPEWTKHTGIVRRQLLVRAKNNLVAGKCFFFKYSWPNEQNLKLVLRKYPLSWPLSIPSCLLRTFFAMG